MVKNILLVAASFHPVLSPRSFRATELAKELARKGHQVSVITESREFDYDAFGQRWGLSIRQFPKRLLPVIRLEGNRVKKLVNKALRRGLLMLFEYPDIELMLKTRQALKHEKHYDLLITFAVPHPVHWGTAWARKANRPIANTWIADCGDPFMKNKLDTYMKFFYFRYLEKWFCRKADFITVPFAGAVDGYYPEFHHKIRIIPQGFEFDLNSRPRENPANDVTSFAYAGGFIPGSRDPGPLLRFLVTVKIPFKFFIFTRQPEFATRFQGELGERLIVQDYMDRSALIQFMSGMDFLINLDNNTSLQSPSKLIDYAISGRPVLNVGQPFNKNDLLAFLNKDYSRRMALDDLDQYHISHVSHRFLELTAQQ